MTATVFRNLRQRSFEPEILDGPGVPDDVRERCYHDLARTQRWLGNWAAILGLLRRDPLPVRTVLDIGCGHGALLGVMQLRLGVTAIGIDTAPPAAPRSTAVILRADAVRDSLPAADVAVCLMMAHHLSEEDLAAMIRNVGRACRRFLILDLVRHPLPLVLFRSFVAPCVNAINVADGIRSIERSYTTKEMAKIVRSTGARFQHHCSPIHARQIVDIVYDGG